MSIDFQASWRLNPGRWACMTLRRAVSRVASSTRVSLALILACSVTAVVAPAAGARTAMRYEYVSPIPGSSSVSPWNNIAIRPGGIIDQGAVDASSIAVVGSRSGAHVGDWHLADDARTLIFVPLRPYAPGETVAVTLRPETTARAGESLPPLAFEFSVASTDPRSLPPPTSRPSEFTEARARGASTAPAAAQPPAAVAADLPPGLPHITVLASNNPEPGCVFTTPRTNSLIAPLLIVDNLGMPIFYRLGSSDAVDFKKWPTDRLTYFDLGRSKSYALDSLYAVVDSFAAGNGYLADFHDLQLLPNGHALLIIFDTQAVGMDTVVAGGDPDAFVYGLVVQELDASKNVVFQWRSWDHFQITDALGINLTAPTIDYVHGNAVELDVDGNLMISSKRMNEITKINRQTGDIIWRWGLNAVHNDFTFVGDTRGFSYQHDIRRTSDGHVTLFDNGNLLSPPYSRGLEYALDEQNKTATLVREYLPTGGGYSPSAGSTQRRASGGTMIGWGTGGMAADATDYHPDGSKALELAFDTASMTSYRAFRFEWQGKLITTDQNLLDFGSVDIGDTLARLLVITNNGPAPLTVTSFVSTNAAFSTTAAVPLAIPSGASTTVQVRFHPTAGGVASGMLYVRSVSTAQLVASAVELRGVGVQVTVVPGRRASGQLSLAQNRPNPARDALAIPFSIARSGIVTLRVYDLSGRVVATLLDGPLPAGDHIARWDGTRGDGGTAPPGEYSYELRSSGERLQRRLILFR